MHIPEEVVRLIGDVLHSARFRSETQAVIAMLEGASDRLNEVGGYVYLMRGIKGLKIGTSIQPHQRAKTLKSELLYCISGDRLTELAVHALWGRYRLSGEWFEDRNDIVEWFRTHDLSVFTGDIVDMDRGEPLREKRVVVMMSAEDYEKLKSAAQKMGVGVSTYMRVKSLEAAQ